MTSSALRYLQWRGLRRAIGRPVGGWAWLAGDLEQKSGMR